MTETVREQLDTICRVIRETVETEKIYLFGSYAYGTPDKDSDFDIYVVMPDHAVDLAGLTAGAYKAIRNVKKRPVDIVLGTLSRFNARKQFPSIEQEVDSKGVVLYG